MTYRVAILGAGIGREHMDGYTALGERFRVTQVCDLDAARAEALAAPVGAACASSIDAVLANPEVDIVDICLPPSLHVPTAERVLASGKHVICEKPIAGSPKDAGALADAEATSGKRFFPVFQYRFGPAFSALEALRTAGLLGAPRVAAAETHWNRKRDYYANHWRGTWAHEMGGAVLSHAIHIHDLLRHEFGPVAEVSAFLDTLINPIETEDCGAILFRFATGALATSSITLGAADDCSRLKLVYEHLTAESDSLPYQPGQGNWRFLARTADAQAEVDRIVADASARRANGFAGLFEAIADALDGADERAPTLADGIASIHLAAAIYRSQRHGMPVALPLDASSEEYARLAPEGA
ncbi:Gfo/Idh/MocA family protein [Tropicimonas sp. IMCC6043]|uniref:Gfo/Idh/MocA family protein n=1 Tax=Tropicimonas sp. IMCC6043 TaxID=2510645 RepID=UPI00101D09F0|nr:Gfo/Idh/MocA family oxidoreductase [Tropicimonas sp. IMCC6043]RYH11619.1 Gfo/Idh/MocA family oxidoreductase [Tropicimonas sp. IMCC6043]